MYVQLFAHHFLLISLQYLKDVSMLVILDPAILIKQHRRRRLTEVPYIGGWRVIKKKDQEREEDHNPHTYGYRRSKVLPNVIISKCNNPHGGSRRGHQLQQTDQLREWAQEQIVVPMAVPQFIYNL